MPKIVVASMHCSSLRARFWACEAICY